MSAINVAFDLDLNLRVYGARTELPTDWFTVIAVAIICLIAWGISAIMSSRKVGNLFQKHSWLKWATPIVITLVVVLGFYATYYSIEYAGPLHYATRSNNVETVNELLEEGVDIDDYDEAVYECVELDHVEVLKILLKDPKAVGTINKNFILAIESGSRDILITFIDAGVGSEGEYGDFLAEFLAVSHISKEDRVKVGLKLFEAGASPDGIYTGGYRGTDLTALEQAKEQGLSKLVEAMENN
jgi:hypothetical protein